MPPAIFLFTVICFDLPSIPVPNSGQRESKHNITPIDPPNSRDTIFVEDYLGGVNFTSIQMNYLSLGEINADSTNFNYILKAKKARGNDSEIDIFIDGLFAEIRAYFFYEFIKSGRLYFQPHFFILNFSEIKNLIDQP